MQFFIMGSGRSGTSIFNRVVGEHDEIWSFRWESQIFSGLPPLVELLDASGSDKKVEKFVERCRTHLYKRNVGGRYDAGLFELIREEKFILLLENLENDIKLSGSNREERVSSCRKFSDAIFQTAADREGKSVWCEKTPRNLLYADMIKELYPKAKFVNVIRDGREVASSILEKKFWPVAKSSRFKETLEFGGDVSLEKAVNYWVTLMGVTEKMRRLVGEENWLDIRLEDLGADLGGVQNRLEGFLDVPHDTGFLDKAGNLVKSGKADQKRWKIGREESDIEFMEAEMRPYLEKYGYAI